MHGVLGIATRQDVENAMRIARRVCILQWYPRTKLELAQLVQARPGLFAAVATRLRKNRSKIDKHGFCACNRILDLLRVKQAFLLCRPLAFNAYVQAFR